MIGLDKHILYLAYVNDTPITILQLNKIYYFTLGYLIRNRHKEIAKEEFKDSNLEHWVYGAVVPSLFNEYKYHKSTPIFDKGSRNEYFNKEDINNHILHLINTNPFILVDINKSQVAKNNNNLKYHYKYTFKDLEFYFSEDS